MDNFTTTDMLPDGEYRNLAIPKRNGSVRYIAAPDEDLLEYQQSALKSLNTIFFGLLSKTSVYSVPHGFIPNRSPVSAAKQHIGYDITIKIDIKDFFDSVTVDHIKKTLEKFDTNNKVKNTHILDNPNFWHIKGYAAQGFATSPIIANIAILPALQQIKEYLSRGVATTMIHKNYCFTIYADDICISFNNVDKIGRKNKRLKPNWTLIRSIIFKTSAILERHGFKVNQKKTKILQAKHGYRKILGVNVGSDHIRATRKTRRRMRAAQHQANGPSLGGLTSWSNHCTRK